jgi:hypothetical protein
LSASRAPHRTCGRGSRPSGRRRAGSRDWW